jgi:hypothetical protein
VSLAAAALALLLYLLIYPNDHLGLQKPSSANATASAAQQTIQPRVSLNSPSQIARSSFASTADGLQLFCCCGRSRDRCRGRQLAKQAWSSRPSYETLAPRGVQTPEDVRSLVRSLQTSKAAAAAAAATSPDDIVSAKDAERLARVCQLDQGQPLQLQGSLPAEETLAAAAGAATATANAALGIAAASTPARASRTSLRSLVPSYSSPQLSQISLGFECDEVAASPSNDGGAWLLPMPPLPELLHSGFQTHRASAAPAAQLCEASTQTDGVGQQIAITDGFSGTLTSHVSGRADTLGTTSGLQGLGVPAGVPVTDPSSRYPTSVVGSTAAGVGRRILRESSTITIADIPASAGLLLDRPNDGKHIGAQLHSQSAATAGEAVKPGILSCAAPGVPEKQSRAPLHGDRSATSQQLGSSPAAGDTSINRVLAQSSTGQYSPAMHSFTVLDTCSPSDNSAQPLSALDVGGAGHMVSGIAAEWSHVHTLQLNTDGASSNGSFSAVGTPVKAGYTYHRLGRSIAAASAAKQEAAPQQKTPLQQQPLSDEKSSAGGDSQAVTPPADPPDQHSSPQGSQSTPGRVPLASAEEAGSLSHQDSGSLSSADDEVATQEDEEEGMQSVWKSWRGQLFSEDGANEARLTPRPSFFLPPLAHTQPATTSRRIAPLAEAAAAIAATRSPPGVSADGSEGAAVPAAGRPPRQPSLPPATPFSKEHDSWGAGSHASAPRTSRKASMSGSTGDLQALVASTSGSGLPPSSRRNSYLQGGSMQGPLRGRASLDSEALLAKEVQVREGVGNTSLMVRACDVSC